MSRRRRHLVSSPIFFLGILPDPLLTQPALEASPRSNHSQPPIQPIHHLPCLPELDPAASAPLAGATSDDPHFQDLLLASKTGHWTRTPRCFSFSRSLCFPLT